MNTAVTTLASTVSGEALWGVFANAIPYISVVILFAFGFYLIKKMLRGLPKGRAKVG